MRVGDRLKRGLGIGIPGGYHERAGCEVLCPGERALDHAAGQIPGCRALHHGPRHAADSLRRARRAVFTVPAVRLARLALTLLMEALSRPAPA
jgi:hypothetical protein